MSTAPVNLAQSINQSWVSIEDSSVIDCPVLPEKAPPNSLLLSELSYVGEPEVKSSNEVKKMCIVTKKKIREPLFTLKNVAMLIRLSWRKLSLPEAPPCG